ncbi:hypothetical protein CYMTET_6256 [Cymbomonas tetramitiformis]|uniref:PCI domain-containing protein n=1 Tax=Cymbomonas tetramitiformis TaxID=36881 RepID=A0AAE0LIL2_9CHLO|nr:hypothetical protein CYMTET_6256 [Cymbomonas tetramitiformis]|eukprot:gene11910-14066_t
MSAPQNETVPEAMDTDKMKKGKEELAALEVQIGEYKALAKVNFEEALEKLLALEKQKRLAAEMAPTRMVCVAIVQACFVTSSWARLNEHIILLSKRRSQIKQAVVGMVQESMTYIEKTPDMETRVELISTLSTVTSGKIYVEVERARLVRQLAKIKEDQGKVDEAAELMQEVAVETFGAMAKTEKVMFILEQVRLCLLKKDYVRAAILAKKISPRTFMEKEAPKEKTKKATADQEAPPEQAALEGTPLLPELKLMYYELMIQIHKEANEYLDICRCYQAVYQDKAVADDATRWAPVLTKIAWYVVLAKHGSEQSSMLHSVAAEKKLQELPAYHSLLKQFITMEVIRWPTLKQGYEAEMASEADIFGGEIGAKRIEDVHQRVVEHNILVIRKYYSRLKLERLAEMLDLSEDEAERHLSDMVVSKVVSAKLDRPAGIIAFQDRSKQEPTELLNSWASNIERVLALVDQSCHKIHKECVTHKVPIGA